jgi:hypothetical protein
MRTKSRIIAAVLTLFAFATSCKKELPNQYEIFEGQTKQNELPQDNDSSIVYAENTLLIDTTNYVLESTPEMIEEGIFLFSSADSIGMNIKVGDVFLYQGDGGHLREVVSINKGKRSVTIETKQGTLAKLFSSASLTMEDSKAVVNFPMEDFKIYENGPEVISISGDINFESGYLWDLEYNDGLKKFEFGTKEAKMSVTGNLNYQLSKGFELNKEKVLFSVTKKVWLRVYGIPIIPVYVTNDIVAKIEANLETSLKSSVTSNFNTPLDQVINYNGQQWNYTSKFEPTTNVTFSPPEDEIGGKLQVSIGPRTSIKLLNSVGPYGEGMLDLIGEGKASLINKVWQLKATGQLSTKLGVGAEIFDYASVDYNKTWVPYSWDIYTTPYELKLISGENQEFKDGEVLAQPIVVQVLDSDKESQSNVYVKAELGTNDGELISDKEVRTDAEGKASFTWKPKDKDSKLKLVLKDPDGKDMEGSPVEVKVKSELDIAQMLIDYGPWKTKTIIDEGVKLYQTWTISGYNCKCFTWKDYTDDIENEYPFYGEIRRTNESNVFDLQIDDDGNENDWAELKIDYISSDSLNATIYPKDDPSKQYYMTSF